MRDPTGWLDTHVRIHNNTCVRVYVCDCVYVLYVSYPVYFRGTSIRNAKTCKSPSAGLAKASLMAANFLQHRDEACILVRRPRQGQGRMFLLVPRYQSDV